MRLPVFQRRVVILCLICILVGAACAGRTAYNAPAANAADQPTAQLNVEDAEHVAADFLNAWTLDSFEGMYGLLAVNSRDAFARKDFEQLYTDAERRITLLQGGKSYALTNALRQGTTADIAYDMTFKTQVFGEFTDAGRVLHLVTTPDGWRVAWSPGDIFAEMKDGAVLDISETTPNRGNIYDHDGDVIADQNGVAVRVTLHTQAYPGGNPDSCFGELARVFKTRSADQMKQLYGSRTGLDYIFDIGELSQETIATEKDALERVCKLSYTSIPTRRYVAGGLAPHIVGHVGRIPAETLNQWIAQGYKQDALVGLDGIERYWETTLAGRGEATLIIRSRDGSTRTLAKRDAQPSQSVYLTIDRKLQEAVQGMFKEAFDTAIWGKWSTGAAAVVMDVHTGEILAIASYPDFNVDAFNPYTSLKDAQALIDNWYKDPKKPTFSRATLGQYPLGSVFKIVSMAAAADSGKFKLTSTLACSGIWNGGPLGDRTRLDWLKRGHGIINLKQALIGSCDVYFWNVGWTLDKANPQILVDYAHRMGFGAPTGIKDVSESAGRLPDPKNYEQINGTKWRSSDALNLVIGQGDVQVTPLQVVRMVAAVANGGTLYQPLLVEKVGIINQPSYIATPVPNGKLDLKPEVLTGIQESMCGVTTNPTLGTAEFIYRGFKGAVVCGKTGTAQAGLEGDLPHAWFAAYAGKTADKPDIAVVVIVEHSNEGSYVAAPIVKRIIETYYGLPISPWPDFWQGGLPTVTSGD
jgi:cell division protein FtsI/penicillin-binding protein 2